MPRKFKTADYASTLKLTVSLEDAVPPNHLARFIVDVVSQLDLSAIYARYGERGGEALAPEVLLGVVFYGYATGVFSSRKLEKATYESLPFRFVAGDLHPDHDTLAHATRQLMRIFAEASLRGRDFDELEHLQRSLARKCAIEIQVYRGRFGDLVADFHNRIQARHRLREGPRPASDVRGCAAGFATDPDSKLLAATLDSVSIERPEPTPAQPQGLCLDRGYDYRPVCELRC